MRRGRGVHEVAELVVGDDVAHQGLVEASVAALRGVGGPDVALQGLHVHLLHRPLASGLQVHGFLPLVGDGHTLEAGRDRHLPLGHVLAHLAHRGRVEDDGDAQRALLGVIARGRRGVRVLDLGRKVGEQDDVVVGERQVLGVIEGEQRLHRLLERGQAKSHPQLLKGAGLLELLDDQLALECRPKVRSAMHRVRLDGREHRGHELLPRLAHVDEFDLLVLGAVVARARHLGVLPVAHQGVGRIELRVARTELLELGG